MNKKAFALVAALACTCAHAQLLSGDVTVQYYPSVVDSLQEPQRQQVVTMFAECRSVSDKLVSSWVKRDFEELQKQMAPDWRAQSSTSQIAARLDALSAEMGSMRAASYRSHVLALRVGDSPKRLAHPIVQVFYSVSADKPNPQEQFLEIWLTPSSEGCRATFIHPLRYFGAIPPWVSGSASGGK